MTGQLPVSICPSHWCAGRSRLPLPSAGAGGKGVAMVLGDTQKMNMYWELTVTDVNDNDRKYVYYGGAFVDIVYKDKVIDTFSVYDFINGRRTVESVEQLLAVIERRMYAADK